MAYTVNEDGSVTKIEPSQQQPPYNGGSRDNSGCWTSILYAVLFWIIFFLIAQQCDTQENSSQTSNYVQTPSANMPETYSENVENNVYPEQSYINISSSSVTFDSDGGTYTFTVNSNKSWHIDTYTANWGHLSPISGNELLLRVDANNSTESRTDFFVIAAGDKSIQVDISQRGKPIIPSANISNVWMTHGDYQNGVRGMTIHVSFSTENLKDQQIYVKALFYYGDNSTILQDVYGNHLVKTESSCPSYVSTVFEDFKLFIPYDWLKFGMEQGEGTCTLSFDISVHDSSGKQLDIDENTQFDYTSR